MNEQPLSSKWLFIYFTYYTKGTTVPFSEYDLLISDIEDATQKVKEFYSGQLNCSPGCAHCCKDFSIFPIEIASLQRAKSMIAQYSKPIMSNLKQFSRCPLLVDDLCVLYKYRPIICRTQGLPAAYIDQEHQTVEVSACHINFPESYQFHPEKLLLMDSFIERLQDINKKYIASVSPSFTETRIPIREKVKEIFDQN